MASEISLRNVTKRFTTRKLGTVTAVDNFNLEIEEGECFAFLGPSGCGKTTTLRMIAGFEDLSEGEIYLSGRPVSIKARNMYLPPEERGLGMVFQAFAVWPHLNVFENVAFPLRVQKRPKNEIVERVHEALKHTDLLGLEGTYPSDLSGGQQQRIALARAIVTNPRIMLLDEPLSNLDPQLRESMRFEIKELQKKFNFTIIFVTHDQSEAMALSDRILVMDMGKIVQVGTPKELYNRPCNRFVHSFLGESNFMRVKTENGKAYVQGSSQIIPIDLPKDYEAEMLLATRPNNISLLAHKEHDSDYKAKIIKRIFLTNFTEYLIKVGDEVIKVQTPNRLDLSTDSECYLRFEGAMWYKNDDEELEKIRNKRQLI